MVERLLVPVRHALGADAPGCANGARLLVPGEVVELIGAEGLPDLAVVLEVGQVCPI